MITGVTRTGKLRRMLIVMCPEPGCADSFITPLSPYEPQDAEVVMCPCPRHEPNGRFTADYYGNHKLIQSWQFYRKVFIDSKGRLRFVQRREYEIKNGGTV